MSGAMDRRAFLAKSGAVGAGVALAGSAGGLLAACGSSSTGGGQSQSDGTTSAPPRRGGMLTFGTEAEETGFDPTSTAFDTTGLLYARAVFDPLAVIGADGTVQPYLAQSIEPNDDASSWTITLRPNVLFHDGTPCDGAALANSLTAFTTSALTKAAVQNISDISVSGPLSVTVKMATPWVPFDYYLAGGIGGNAGYVPAPAMLKNPNGTSHPVGTGPFVFSEWVTNNHFTATRNPHYWRPNLPYLDAITFKPIPDAEQLYQSLLTGQVDMMHTTSANVTKQLRSQSSYSLVDDSKHVIGEPDMDCVLLNTSKAPFDDVDVRRACAMAVDSAQFAAIVQLGVEQPSNGPFPSGSPYDGTTAYPKYDPSGARAILSRLKAQGKSLSFTLGSTPDPVTQKIAQYLQSQFNTVGMDCTISTNQQASGILTAITGGFQAMVWRQFSALDPDINYIFWSSTTASGGFALNMARNADPAIEAALLQGRRSKDPAVRQEAYRTVNNLLGKDVPYIWTARTVWSVAANSRVKNFNAPTTPDNRPAYGMITGAIMLPQIWLAK